MLVLRLTQAPSPTEPQPTAAEARRAQRAGEHSGVWPVPGVVGGGGAGPPVGCGSQQASEGCRTPSRVPESPLLLVGIRMAPGRGVWRQPCSVPVEAKFQNSGTSRWKGVG